MSDGGKLRVAAQEWLAGVDVSLEAFARQVCFAMGEAVIDSTPIVDGFLVGSWQPSIGGISGEDGSKSDKSTALANLGIVILDVKLGDVFYMYNNAAYAMRIEYGFVGADSLGRVYNQAGQFNVTKVVASYPEIAANVVKELSAA